MNPFARSIFGLRTEYDKSNLSSHWMRSRGRVDAPVAALIINNCYKLQIMYYDFFE